MHFNKLQLFNLQPPLYVKVTTYTDVCLYEGNSQITLQLQDIIYYTMLNDMIEVRTH